MTTRNNQLGKPEHLQANMVSQSAKLKSSKTENGANGGKTERRPKSKPQSVKNSISKLMGQPSQKKQGSLQGFDTSSMQSNRQSKQRGSQNGVSGAKSVVHKETVKQKLSAKGALFKDDAKSKVETDGLDSNQFYVRSQHNEGGKEVTNYIELDDDNMYLYKSEGAKSSYDSAGEFEDSIQEQSKPAIRQSKVQINQDSTGSELNTSDQ